MSVKPTVAMVPFKAAVNTTIWGLETVPAVTLKLVFVAPAATVTEAGVARSLLLLFRLTITPPAGALRKSATTQLLAAPVTSTAGVQVSPASAGRTEIVPPVASVVTKLAEAEAPKAVPRRTFAFAGLLASLNCAVATSPLGITLTFGPVARQVYVPEAATQLRLLEAAVKAGDAVTVTLAMLAAGY